MIDFDEAQRACDLSWTLREYDRGIADRLPILAYRQRIIDQCEWAGRPDWRDALLADWECASNAITNWGRPKLGLVK